MRTTIIHLETHDDVILTRDKMDWCKTGRILLVFPNGPFGINRRLDLLLLLRHSQKLGAQLALVCEDVETGIKARKLGIPVFQTEMEAQRRPWRRAHFRPFEKDGEAGQTLGELKRWAQNTGWAGWKDGRVRAAAFGIGMLAFAALILVFLPYATLTLAEVQVEQSVEIALRASPHTLLSKLAGEIPAHPRLVVVEGQAEAPASATIHSPGATAGGLARFTNLGGSDVVVPAGTVLIALLPIPVRYVVENQVVVPGGAGQSAATWIRAEKAGASGNIPADQIRGIEGNLGLRLTVTNPAAILGGTDELVKAPSGQDYARLKEGLLAQLQDQALADLEAKAQTGEKFLAATLSLSRVVVETHNPPAGIPAEAAQIKMRVEYNAWYYQAGDLESVARAVLDATLKADERAIPGTLQTRESQAPVLDPEQRIVQWKVTAWRRTARQISQTLVASMAAGQTLAAAQASLQSEFALLEKPAIQNYPSWWPWLPLLPFRIEVKTEVKNP